MCFLRLANNFRNSLLPRRRWNDVYWWSFLSRLEISKWIRQQYTTRERLFSVYIFFSFFSKRAKWVYYRRLIQTREILHRRCSFFFFHIPNSKILTCPYPGCNVDKLIKYSYNHVKSWTVHCGIPKNIHKLMKNISHIDH